MSASTEKKQRQAAREAGTDKKTLAEQEAAKKKAKSNRRWTLGTIGVILLIALILFLNSSFLYTHTTAISIGDASYSPAEVNYVYANRYYNWIQSYGSYASIFGLDTSTGIAGLKQQECPMYDDGRTWRDYFMEEARSELSQMTVLCAWADANGITLTDEEIAEVDDSIATLDSSARAGGYASGDKYFSANYGTGVTSAIVREMALKSALANKASSEYASSLEYTDAELEEHYQSFDGAQDKFSFSYYLVNAEKVESTDADGNTSSAVTEETTAAAKDAADDILTAYTALKQSNPDDDNYTAMLNSAVAQVAPTAEATERSNITGGNLGDYKEWLMESGRKAGDATVVDKADGSGSYVVVFLDRSDNHYPVAQVRHILIKAVADSDGSYTDKAKEIAKNRAEEILAEFNAGDKTEDSFAELAKDYSEDTGSAENGGLYDTVYKGATVEEFDKFCFEGHKKGDTAIVYGESSSYAGYHVMYYVGEGDLYSNLLAKNDLVNTTVSQWLEDQVNALTVTNGWWLRIAG